MIFFGSGRGTPKQNKKVAYEDLRDDFEIFYVFSDIPFNGLDDEDLGRLFCGNFDKMNVKDDNIMPNMKEVEEEKKETFAFSIDSNHK